MPTVSSEQRDGCSVRASTTSPSNTVDVILRVVRVVIVYHVSNIPDILNTAHTLAKTRKS
jgi:hypothetical protein